MRQLSKEIHDISNIYHDVVIAGKDLLNNDVAKRAKEYIRKRISANNIKKFDIGYFPDDKNLDLITNTIDEEKLKKLKLVNEWKVYDVINTNFFTKSFFCYNNIIFPYRDEYGNIIALSGRTYLNDDEIGSLGVDIPKYKNTFFTKSLHLFGLYQAKKAIYVKDYVIVVEGQIDCISCHEYGIHNVVAVCGSDLSRYQFYLLKKMTNNIYLLFDNDSAGERARKKIVSKYGKFANIKNISFSSKYLDVDKYLHESPINDILDNL